VLTKQPLHLLLAMP